MSERENIVFYFVKKVSNSFLCVQERQDSFTSKKRSILPIRHESGNRGLLLDTCILFLETGTLLLEIGFRGPKFCAILEKKTSVPSLLISSCPITGVQIPVSSNRVPVSKNRPLFPGPCLLPVIQCNRYIYLLGILWTATKLYIMYTCRLWLDVFSSVVIKTRSLVNEG